MPESYNQGQGLELVRLTTLNLDGKDSSPVVILKKDQDRYVDITGRSGEETGKPGVYILFKKTYYSPKAWHGGYSYVDLLVPGVTEKSLELTMKG